MDLSWVIWPWHWLRLSYMAERRLPKETKRTKIQTWSGFEPETWRFATHCSNYRPVSSLPFLSKILEKLVAKQLEAHLSSHRLHDNLQSAYRTGHSTETALLKVDHNIAEALDSKCMAALVLLDLSAAFDVTDHKILQTRLEHSFGVIGSALYWIKSYLSDRSQCIARGRIRGLAVACWTTYHYHPCSNPGVGISGGYFVFHFVSLALEIARPI